MSGTAYNGFIGDMAVLYYGVADSTTAYAVVEWPKQEKQ